MNNAKVLIVEDERIIVKDLENNLIDLGYQVVGHSVNSVDAINKVRDLAPDLVLMDIFIEGQIDGIETAHIISQSYNVPVVFLTAYSDIKTIERAKQIQPYGYLLKPFGNRELYAAVEIALYKFRLESKVKIENQLLHRFLQQQPLISTEDVDDALRQISIRSKTFEKVNEPVLVIDEKGLVYDYNEQAIKLLKISGREGIGKPVSDYFSINTKLELTAMLNESEHFGHVEIRNGSRMVQLSCKVRRILSEHSKPMFAISLYSSVAEVPEKQSELEDVFHRLQTITNHLDNVVIYESGAGRDYVSDNVVKMLGYSFDQFNSHDFFWTLIHPDDLDKIHHSSYDWYYKESQDTWVDTYRLRRADGQYIWVQDQMFQVKNKVGVKYKIGLLIDIDDRIRKQGELEQSEARLIKSLNEKDLLIQEIHHRVRNNLQIITSLLNLQLTFIDDKRSYSLIQESQNRVRTLALIHEKLYMAKDISRINFTEYLKNLVNNLFRTYHVDVSRIKLFTEVDDLLMPVDTATPCGLIINEIISNIFKHAFPASRPGSIYISLKANEGSVEIRIKDDGVGLPENFNMLNSETLGMMLIASLSEQIKAEISLHSDNGTEFSLKFQNVETSSNIG